MRNGNCSILMCVWCKDGNMVDFRLQMWWCDNKVFSVYTCAMILYTSCNLFVSCNFVPAVLIECFTCSFMSNNLHLIWDCMISHSRCFIYVVWCFKLKSGLHEPWMFTCKIEDCFHTVTTKHYYRSVHKINYNENDVWFF